MLTQTDHILSLEKRLGQVERERNAALQLLSRLKGPFPDNQNLWKMHAPRVYKAYWNAVQALQAERAKVADLEASLETRPRTRSEVRVA